MLLINTFYFEYRNIEFPVSTAVTVQFATFVVVTPCSLVGATCPTHFHAEETAREHNQ
jgi:hypothetical protein